MPCFRRRCRGFLQDRGGTRRKVGTCVGKVRQGKFATSPSELRFRAASSLLLGIRAVARWSFGITVNRTSIPTALNVYICPVARRKYVFSDFLLQAVARGLAAGSAVMREGECSGESCFCFPLVVGH
jgi:hypothetical protein